MTNETRLIIEAGFFIIAMTVIIFLVVRAAIKARHRSPAAIDIYRRLVDESARDLNARMDEYDARQARDRQEIDRLHADLAAWKAYARQSSQHSQQLVDMLHEMGFQGEIPPPPEPPSTPHYQLPGSNSENDRRLAAELADAFNLEELEDLAFHLGIAADTIPGDTVPVRARELVRYCRRRGMTERLRKTAAEKRPRRNE